MAEKKAKKAKAKIASTHPGDDPLWYKDAVIYELHVKSFCDSDGDGVGDFPGLTSKLGYLQDLGVTALWLLPFYPSPQRDDGYDIADYCSVNPTYGTLEDFRTFLDAAHARGLRVITELVINHTSDQHPWFQRARRAPIGSPERDYYVWTDDPTRYHETRIIFTDTEPSNWTWDPVAAQYYWHRFFHHQPDLNFESPAVHEKLFEALDFWMEMGVDGMRLDAIPYLYERDGTNCENLPETHVFLKQVRSHVEARYTGRMLLAEANQWPEDAARYFGDGDECHMNFHFPIMPRLFMSLRMEDRFPIVDILAQTPAIPPTSQWAVFLRNHDELTLEMVTDEERDYMYRVYAHEQTARINVGIRRRLAPLLENDQRKIEMMNSLLFALPGTPVLYYGDEIAMGDNFYLGDRHGVRTPMQWSGDRNAGFSRANAQRLFLPVIVDPEYHYESVNVEAQHANPSSLLWWMRRLIALRRQHRAFGRGTLEWVNPVNKRVLAFVRKFEGETILVVVNLSRLPQAAELDLSSFTGSVPVEMFGQTPFPACDAEPYRLTLGPNGFFWFVIQPASGVAKSGAVGAGRGALPLIRVKGGWETVLEGGSREALEKALTGWIGTRRWFGGKGRKIRRLKIEDSVPIPGVKGRGAHLIVLSVEYIEEETERYAVPLAWIADGAKAGSAPERDGNTICRIGTADGVTGTLRDAADEHDFARTMLTVVGAEERHQGSLGEVVGMRQGPPGQAPTPRDAALPARVGSAEQSNTSLIYGDRWILKMYRRLEEGVNLDRELGEHLTLAGFPHTPDVLGAIEYRRGKRAATTLAVLQPFMANQGDAWELTADSLGRYVEQAMAAPKAPWALPLPGPLFDAARKPLPPAAERYIEKPYLEAARLLGLRTGEMHKALATGATPELSPEAFSQLYQRSFYQSMRNLLGKTLRTLEQELPGLSTEARRDAERLLARRDDLMGRAQSVLDQRIDGQRIRVHGDYHLGQVLFTGNDFVVIDFEGEPARPLSERRLKRSALRDVAGMLRSFQYAVGSALAREGTRGVAGADETQRLEGWGRFWHRWVSVAFLGGYMEVAGDQSFLPGDDASRQLLLDVLLLEKALYELSYELGSRPDWVRIPMLGILDLLEGDGPA